MLSCWLVAGRTSAFSYHTVSTCYIFCGLIMCMFLVFSVLAMYCPIVLRMFGFALTVLGIVDTILGFVS